MANKQASASASGRRGGYAAGSKTARELRPPPPAFGQPKTNAKPSEDASKQSG